MNVRITSSVWEEVAADVQAATNYIEQVLNDALSGDYDLDLDVLFVVVAVSADPSENERFSKPHNKVGFYKRWPSPEKRRIWSVAVEFAPDTLEGRSVDQLKQLIAEGVRRQIVAPKKKPPKLFNYSAFRDGAFAALNCM